MGRGRLIKANMTRRAAGCKPRPLLREKACCDCCRPKAIACHWGPSSCWRRYMVAVVVVNDLRPPATVPLSTPHDRPLLDAWQAEIEMAQARRAEESSRQAERRRRQAGEDEDEEASDEVVMRARALDDWKDEHPSGYGNSKLRPTA